MPEKVLSYTVIYEPLEEGGYMVTVPSLPGIVTQGDDLEEARAMAEDAIQCHLAGLAKDGDPIPNEAAATIKIEKINIHLKTA